MSYGGGVGLAPLDKVGKALLKAVPQKPIMDTRYAIDLDVGDAVLVKVVREEAGAEEVDAGGVPEEVIT